MRRWRHAQRASWVRGALALEPQLDRTLIVNLNGGEEMGLWGAAGFLRHPWAKDVRAYVYLEALPGGKAVLIGAGPGNPWLAATYAREVSAPVGNMLAQELAQSGLLPFSGDFIPLHQAGVAGLDIAMVGDGWAVHTALDRLNRLEPGGLQHMGDSALAVTRALASGTTSLAPASEPPVYYDVLGLFMVAYPRSVGRALGLAALVAFAVMLVQARRRRSVSLLAVLAASGWMLLAVVVAVLAAFLPALALKLLLNRSLGWFAQRALVIACFVLPATAGMLFVLSRWRTHAARKMNGDLDKLTRTAWLGSLLFWAVWLAPATLTGTGAGYIAFYWVAGGALGLLVATVSPSARLPGFLLALLPGAVVTIEVATLIIMNIVPMAGMTPPEVPSDMVVSVLVALSTALVGVVAFTLPCRAGRLGRAALVFGVLGTAGILLTAFHAPYSASRPKRLFALHTADDDGSALLLATAGADGMKPLAGVLPDAAPISARWDGDGVMGNRSTSRVCPHPARQSTSRCARRARSSCNCEQSTLRRPPRRRYGRWLAGYPIGRLSSPIPVGKRSSPSPTARSSDGHLAPTA